MLFLRVVSPVLTYRQEKDGNSITLNLLGSPFQTLYVPQHGGLKVPVRVTLSSERRGAPYEVGSVGYSCTDTGNDLGFDLWLYAPRARVEKYFHSYEIYKYIYIVTNDHNAIIDNEWLVHNDHLAVITDYTIHISHAPLFGQPSD